MMAVQLAQQPSRNNQLKGRETTLRSEAFDELRYGLEEVKVSPFVVPVLTGFPGLLTLDFA